MLFSGFDADTNRLLFDAYDEAMFTLSTDPSLSLDLIYRSQNLVARRLNELAARGVRNRVTLRDAAINVIAKARSTELAAIVNHLNGRNDVAQICIAPCNAETSNRQGENNE